MNLDKLKKEIDIIDGIKHDLKNLIEDYDKIIIIGNGGSNSIASHISQDYTKVLGKKATCFSDPSRLTCYINDYGRDEAYKKYLEHFADKETLIILISSSGDSMNIVNAAEWCDTNSICYVTLSGFNINNKLNNFNPKFKYWVDSTDYGIVENAHQILLHSII
jgi:D-sedoheptulose 7-phosphate isomerase